MAINLPSTPTIGSTFTAGGLTFTWNGTSWNKTGVVGLVKSVNGVGPGPTGNVAVSLANVTTGTLAARPTAASQGDVYVVSGDATATNNGKTFIRTNGGTWEEISGLDVVANDARYVNVSGDTMTGNLVLPADPTLALEAATKQYVDSKSSGLSSGNQTAQPAAPSSDTIWQNDNTRAGWSKDWNKVYFYDQSRAAWFEVGHAAMKAPAISNTTLTLTNQYTNLLVNSNGGAVTLTLPATPEEGQYYRIIGGWRVNTVTISAGANSIYQNTSNLGTSYVMPLSTPVITLAWNGLHNRWDMHTEGRDRVVVSDTAPTASSYTRGDLWWDSQNLKLYVLHDDSTTKAWVSASGANGPLTAPVQAVTAGVINCNLGNFYEFTLNGNVTLSFTNPPASGNAYIATVKVNVTTGVLSYPASVKWPGAVSPTMVATKMSILTFMTFDGGTTWIANALTDY